MVDPLRAIYSALLGPVVDHGFGSVGLVGKDFNVTVFGESFETLVELVLW